MIFSKKSISDLLSNSQHMIDIASSDEFIKTSLLQVNFDEIKLNNLQLIWKTGDDKAKAYTEAVGTQREQKIAFESTFKESHGVYMKHFKYGKAVCRDDPERAAKHGLNERRERRFNEWLLQSTDFYVKLLEDEVLVEKYGTLGITREELEAGQQGIFTANAAKEDYKTAIGNTQAIKVERDRALMALDKAITDFADDQKEVQGKKNQSKFVSSVNHTVLLPVVCGFIFFSENFEIPIQQNKGIVFCIVLFFGQLLIFPFKRMYANFNSGNKQCLDFKTLFIYTFCG